MVKRLQSEYIPIAKLSAHFWTQFNLAWQTVFCVIITCDQLNSLCNPPSAVLTENSVRICNLQLLVFSPSSASPSAEEKVVYKAFQMKHRFYLEWSFHQDVKPYHNSCDLPVVVGFRNN